MLKRWRTRILFFLAVLGPGFITANVDNDPNGIFTYSQAGAQFGYTMLWTMIPVTLAMLTWIYSIIEAFAKKRVAGDNPWGVGATTLEWTLPSPPPFHQFETLPRIR